MVNFDRFKDGKKHVLTFSYDDGPLQDRRLVEIFNKYGMKATFHLNSKRVLGGSSINKDELAGLYSNHEISCHGVTHAFMTQIPAVSGIEEVLEDRKNLEGMTGQIIRGMSYAYGNYNDDVINILKTCGIVYSRTTLSTGNFGIPENFHAWHPTCHHKSCLELSDHFLGHIKSRYAMPGLFYIWGHSYEIDDGDNWGLIEAFCEKMSGLPNVWYATNIEIYDYYAALRALQISANGKVLHNPSAVNVWVSNDEETVEIKSGETVFL